MPTRTSNRKTRRGEISPPCCFPGLNIVRKSLTEEQVGEKSLSIETELTRKMRIHIKNSGHIKLEALNFFHRTHYDHFSPNAEITSKGENTTQVQAESHGLDSD